MIPPLSLPATPPELRGQTQATLMQKAKELETAFLSEMLSFPALAPPRPSLGVGSAKISSPRSCAKSRRG